MEIGHPNNTRYRVAYAESLFHADYARHTGIGLRKLRDPATTRSAEMPGDALFTAEVT
jgi:hypothetical protein